MATFRRPGKAKAATRQTDEYDNENRFASPGSPLKRGLFLCPHGYSLTQFFIIRLIIEIIIFIISDYYG
ncbi:hypothetical protein EXU11_23900 [Klebsiella quasipneumoniae subsp. quasipneumoniae]|nr:hypothetical protein EXU05_24830 [Klebsiella quasipneumoniae subsp. quasipneumoniae]TBP65055.1 hypothetical protein EXT99_22250 [Klebsiella quasipneumoniae subsp. quasipneumoniae]TBQ01135.1 hypothetical protein EXU07_19785 [Klebsiella quasipneumoniae subsp. quasipneumoniae]TBQ63448.1 hypothetical protein EXU11_23900 [Klebsiella quasipneumoniae subsp. quasipneumoniae]